MTAFAEPGSTLDTTLREVVEALAPIARGAGSPGEKQAAEWIADRLVRAGAADVRIDEERYRHGFARLIGGLSAAGAAAGALALTGRGRRVAAAAAGIAAAGIADDISNGIRPFRRALSSERTTWNVVAEAGDPEGARTLVVLAHHDAAPTGAVFDPSFQRALGEALPGIVERIDTALPIWWPVIGAPGAIAVGAARRRRGMVAAGTLGCLAAAAAFADIARDRIVPGANDNLTAVAVQVALAERLCEEPVEGLRVVLASCGAEEVLQGGIHAFAARYFPALDRDTTFFLNLDTVGSPKLILLEGEGCVVMEDYFDRSFRDLVARAAERAGAPLRRGMRARSSTDSVVPSRAGYPTATIASMDRYKALSNYHLPSDVPENLVWSTVAHAAVVAEAVARELASG